MDMKWMDKFPEYLEKVEMEGEAKGIAKGKAEGIAVQVNDLIEFLVSKFGNVPEQWHSMFAALQDPRSVLRLAIAVNASDSPADFEKLLVEEKRKESKG